MQDVAESQMITVPDGPMDYGNTGMVMFESIGDRENGLIFNSFNTEVGNGILKAMDNYSGSNTYQRSADSCRHDRTERLLQIDRTRRTT